MSVVLSLRIVAQKKTAGVWGLDVPRDLGAQSAAPDLLRPQQPADPYSQRGLDFDILDEVEVSGNLYIVLK